MGRGRPTDQHWWNGANENDCCSAMRCPPYLSEMPPSRYPQPQGIFGIRGAAEPVNSGQVTNTTATVKAKVRHDDGRSDRDWSFDHGALTVDHLGKTVSLGRYVTHEFVRRQLRRSSLRR